MPRIRKYGFKNDGERSYTKGGVARQTYQNRTTRGQLGWFIPQDMILTRHYHFKADWSIIKQVNNVVEDLREMYLDTENLYNKLMTMCAKEGAKILLQALRKFTPVDTGNLRSRWKTYTKGKGANIEICWENDCDYMWAMNYGKHGDANGVSTATYNGYYFLEKAYQETCNKLNEIVKLLYEELRKEVE